MECNGWSNHETWNTATVIDNYEGLFEALRRRMRRTRGSEDPKAEIARWLEVFVTHHTTTGDGRFELPLDDLYAVDWDEIAESYLWDQEQEDAYQSQ